MFVYDLFSHAVNSSDYVVSNVGIVRE